MVDALYVSRLREQTPAVISDALTVARNAFEKQFRRSVGDYDTRAASSDVADIDRFTREDIATTEQRDADATRAQVVQSDLLDQDIDALASISLEWDLVAIEDEEWVALACQQALRNAICAVWGSHRKVAVTTKLLYL